MKTDIIHSAPERLKPAPYQVKSIAVRDARRAVSRCKRANMELAAAQGPSGHFSRLLAMGGAAVLI